MELTGEPDLLTALRKAVTEWIIAKRLDGIVLKQYAYRGNENEVVVGHGQAASPRVGSQEADLMLSLAGSVGKFFNEKLRTRRPAPTSRCSTQC